MKKFLAILLALLCLVMLAVACKKSDKDPEEFTKETDTTAEFVPEKEEETTTEEEFKVPDEPVSDETTTDSSTTDSSTTEKPEETTTRREHSKDY